MFIVLSVMLMAALFVLFMCGYYIRVIKEKYGMNWLYAVPITIAILMVNIVWALMELAKSSRWQ